MSRKYENRSHESSAERAMMLRCDIRTTTGVTNDPMGEEEEEREVNRRKGKDEEKTIRRRRGGQV